LCERLKAAGLQGKKAVAIVNNGNISHEYCISGIWRRRPSAKQGRNGMMRMLSGGSGVRLFHTHYLEIVS
jgi:hypothetical protein